MNKIIKYGWWALIIIPFAFVFGVYVNNGYKINNSSYSDNSKEDTKNEAFMDASKYAYVMPVEPGTKWIYEGRRIFVEINQNKVQETIAQKTVEITGIKKEGNNLRVFTKTSYENEPDFNGGSDSFLVSESGYAFDGTNLVYFPLVKGQRLTSPDLERTDNLYVDYVSSVSIKNVLGKQYRCYDISYYSLPDETLDVFCEGVGYIRDSYRHHGTPNEWDYNLILIEHAALKD